MADAPFEVVVSQDAGGAVVQVTGDVDLATSTRLRDALQQAAATSSSVVRVDMTGVTFLDSSGISVLVDAQQQLGQSSSRLVLHGVGDHVKRVLEISGLGTFFELSDQPTG